VAAIFGIAARSERVSVRDCDVEGNIHFLLGPKSVQTAQQLDCEQTGAHFFLGKEEGACRSSESDFSERIYLRWIGNVFEQLERVKYEQGKNCFREAAMRRSGTKIVLCIRIPDRLVGHLDFK
jgi:hypothetical protein